MSKAVKELIELSLPDRVIAEVHGQDGPTVVFVAGMHGNEHTGITALEKLSRTIKDYSGNLHGHVYFLSGNRRAIAAGKRYLKEDLNRMWFPERIAQILGKPEEELAKEERELFELYGFLNDILERKQGPFYFMDLHTTSSPTQPFLTVNDSLLNRKFTKQYQLPVILGIEEYLNGPILSYMNEIGYVAFGFEGGQHDAHQSVSHHESFVMLSLHFTGVLTLTKAEIKMHRAVLNPHPGKMAKAFEIFHQHLINEGDNFQIEPGFSNFQLLKKGTLIAHSNSQPLFATRTGRIFMPLYQQMGNDGYYSVRKIPRIFLWLSGRIRKWGWNRWFVYLPGITATKNSGQYRVDKHKARFLTKEFIHLFGYRIVKRETDHYVIENREEAAKYKEYRGVEWL